MIKIEIHLSKDQEKALNEFIQTRPPSYEGAAGGRFEYSFTPTNLGEVIKVRDLISKTEVDLTDYSSW